MAISGNRQISNHIYLRLRFRTKLSVLLGSFMLAGCIAPIPVHDEPPFAEAEKAIEVGQTTRRDILDLLGRPEVARRNEQLFAYTDFQERLGIFVIDLGRSARFRIGANHILVIAFDESGKVQNVELATKNTATRNFGLTQTEHCISSGECFVAGQQEIAVLANSDEDRRAKAFESTPDKCTVYLYSEDEIDFSVFVDKRVKLSTFDGSYFMWKLQPGPHLISRNLPEIIKIDINCAAGETLYIRHSVPGWFQKPKFDLVPAAEAQTMIESRRLVLDDI